MTRFVAAGDFTIVQRRELWRADLAGHYTQVRRSEERVMQESIDTSCPD